jgi:hypothetical protein
VIEPLDDYCYGCRALASRLQDADAKNCDLQDENKRLREALRLAHLCIDTYEATDDRLSCCGALVHGTECEVGKARKAAEGLLP